MPASRSNRKAVRMSRILGESRLDDLPPLAKHVVGRSTSNRRQHEARAAENPSRAAVPSPALFPGVVGTTDLGAGYTGHRLSHNHTYRCHQCGQERLGRHIITRAPGLPVCAGCYSRKATGGR